SLRTFGWSWSLSSIRNQVIWHLPLRAGAGRGERSGTAPVPPFGGAVGDRCPAGPGPLHPAPLAAQEGGSPSSAWPPLPQGSAASSCCAAGPEERPTFATEAVAKRRLGPISSTSTS